MGFSCRNLKKKSRSIFSIGDLNTNLFKICNIKNCIVDNNSNIELVYH